MAIIFAGSNGFLDDVAVENIRRFEHELYDFLDNSKPELLDAIRTKKQLDDELKKNLSEAIKQFKQDFQQGQQKRQQQAARAENNGSRGGAPGPAAERPAEPAGAARNPGATTRSQPVGA